MSDLPARPCRQTVQVGLAPLLERTWRFSTGHAAHAAIVANGLGRSGRREIYFVGYWIAARRKNLLQNPSHASIKCRDTSAPDEKFNGNAHQVLSHSLHLLFRQWGKCDRAPNNNQMSNECRNRWQGLVARQYKNDWRPC